MLVNVNRSNPNDSNLVIYLLVYIIMTVKDEKIIKEISTHAYSRINILCCADSDIIKSLQIMSLETRF